MDTIFVVMVFIQSLLLGAHAGNKSNFFIRPVYTPEVDLDVERRYFATFRNNYVFLCEFVLKTHGMYNTEFSLIRLILKI